MKRIASITFACRLLLGAGVCLLLGAGCGGGSQELEAGTLEKAVGEHLAAKVTAIAPGGGTVILLTQQGGGEVVEKAMAAYREGLKAGLGDSYSLKEVGPDISTVQPGEEQIVFDALSRGWPLRAIYNWSRADRDAVAVVSVLPSPMPRKLTPKILSRLPPMIVLEPGPRDDLKQLAQTGALAGLAFPHGNEPGEVGRKSTPEEIFETRYTYFPR